MATAQLSAPLSGAIHVRTRLSGNFTILANRLAQRPGSAATVGVALFINSMPDGTAITIEALREHFTEGETVIGRALRELEADGWLERRIVRCRDGRFATQTYVYTLPELAHADAAQEQAAPPPRQPRPAPSCVGKTISLPSPHAKQPAPESATAAAPHAAPAVPAVLGTQPKPSAEPPAQPAPAPPAPAAQSESSRPPEPALPAAPASPEAVALLTELGTIDPRLTFSYREIDRLAPGVDAWLASGVRAAHITSTLTSDLPTSFRTRPAAVLSWRLEELRPAPTPEPPPPAAPPAPFQTCPDCDRAHRSHLPGRCPFCEHDHRHPIAPPATGAD